MALLTMSGTGDIDHIADLFIHEMQDGAISCRLVDSVRRDWDAYVSMLLVFEKYFLQFNKQARLSIMLNQAEDLVTADVIGTENHVDPLETFSWGAEESFMAAAEDILSELGFEHDLREEYDENDY